uniref:Uncharacterized protein n=1 Tax=Romanomermis culicivorax TaxID=13658 RepID=A0A915L3N7_ROMCU
MYQNKKQSIRILQITMTPPASLSGLLTSKVSISTALIFTLKTMKEASMPTVQELYERQWLFKMTICNVLYHEQKKKKLYDKKEENERMRRQKIRNFKGKNHLDFFFSSAQAAQNHLPLGLVVKPTQLK